MDFKTFIPQSYPIAETSTTAFKSIRMSPDLLYSRGFYPRPLNGERIPKHGDLVDGLLFSLDSAPKKVSVNYILPDGTRVTHEYNVKSSDLVPFQKNILWQPSNFIIPLSVLIFTNILLQTDVVTQIIPVFGFLNRDTSDAFREGKITPFLGNGKFLVKERFDYLPVNSVE